MTTNQPRMTQAERRAAASAAAAQAAQRKRRQQALAGALAGLAVFAVIFTGFFLLQDGGQGTAAPALTTSPQETGGPTEPSPEPSAEFPPVPAGADPALRERPRVSAGKGQITKLKVTPIIEGTGPAAQEGQTVVVNYVGAKYATGEEFDASWDKAQPLRFQLGAGQLIPGFDQGVAGVKVGSRVRLDIPTNLAYGENPGGSAPAGPLSFIVDVLAVE